MTNSSASDGMTSAGTGNMITDSVGSIRQDRTGVVNACDHCGGRFGMVTYRWWGNKFCKRRCKDAFLRELGLGLDGICRWFSVLRGAMILRFWTMLAVIDRVGAALSVDKSAQDGRMVPTVPSPTPCAGRISASLPRKPAPQTSVKAPLPSLCGSCERGHGGFAYQSPHADTEFSATKFFPSCEQHHMLKP